MRTVAYLAIATAVAACSGSSSPSRTAGPPVESTTVSTDKVRAYLLADTTRVSPGQEMVLAVRIDIEPSWQIFWTNPGDSGGATGVSFEVPEDYSAEPARFPAPTRYQAPGGDVTFGYMGRAVVSTTVVVPDLLEKGEQRFGVSVSWTACRAECESGTSTAVMTLPAATPDQPAAPANGDLLAEHERALPKALPKDGSIAVEWSEKDNAYTMAIVVSGRAGALSYFPSSEERSHYIGQIVVPTDAGSSLLVSYKPGAEFTMASGVLAVGDDASRSHFAIRAPKLL